MAKLCLICYRCNGDKKREKRYLCISLLQDYCITVRRNSFSYHYKSQYFLLEIQAMTYSKTNPSAMKVNIQI